MFLGERHRVLNTMHRLWLDFQQFDEIKASRFIHQEILSQVAVNDGAINAQDHQMK